MEHGMGASIGDWQEAMALRMVGDPRQFASVRRITLADGAEKGAEALAFSTGGGLDFWVMADRAMDIGPLLLQGRPIAWQSPAGLRHPALIDQNADGGRGIERGFSGFLQTCGMEHTRGPLGGLPLHGRLPVLPARVIAAGEAFDDAAPHLFCEGTVDQWALNGEQLRLMRRIVAPIGGTSLSIMDRVVNLGSRPQRQAMLYHLNFGWPAIRPGSIVRQGSERVFGPLGRPDAAHPAGAACLPAGAGETIVETPGLEQAPRITIRQSIGSLPHLQCWSHERPGTYVLSVEPITSAMPEPGQPGADPDLAPGEARNYRLDIAFA
jgi:Domain of unknown function (DUF4432)